MESTSGDAVASESSQVHMTPTKAVETTNDACQGAATPVHCKLTWNRCKVIEVARDRAGEVKLSLVAGETGRVGRGHVLPSSDDRTAQH